MGRLYELQTYYEMCRQYMSEAAGHGDVEGFEKWLKIMRKINREIDQLMKENSDGQN